MLITQASSSDKISAALTTTLNSSDKMSAGGVFTIQCISADGQVKWEESLKNLVVNVGLKDMNDKYFTGSAYTATWYIGLYGAASTNNPAAADTASSHAGWTEVVPYSNATRPAATFAAASTANPSVITNSASPSAFTINATATVGGAFLISNNTKSGTTGVLFSASDFASPGDRTVASGDQLNVTYTFSLTAT